MNHLFSCRKKRAPIMAVALLAGVTLAGLISGFLETPRSTNEFLHEHLAASIIANDVTWDREGFDLPNKDKLNIINILKQTEQAQSISDLKPILTGQALKQVGNNKCSTHQEICKFPMRVNRVLTSSNINKDYRVANIMETSRRVDLEIKAGGGDIRLTHLTDETRALRFYQTQSGWMHKMSTDVQGYVPSFTDRAGAFRTRFAQGFTGLNYYPASAPWADFWAKFPLEDIKVDLETAKALNVNALRIFLNHDYFDMAETREDALSKLNMFLDLCAARDIQVLVTLFDLRPDYTLANWNADIKHIDAILTATADHKAILGIDIKNQADLDFNRWGQGRVEVWLTVMARHIQTQYPQLAVTAGWSNAQHAVRLKDVFDIITYHEYENPKGFEVRLGKIIQAVAGKPVMITELGTTIWKPPFITQFGESAQASRLNTQLTQAGQANGVFVWTLHDFDHVGKEIVGPLPWRRAQQKYFGLVRSDGTDRPAAKILKSFGNPSQTQPNPTPSHSIQNTHL